MSERINVDHAFDPEARQAQADLDAYMDTRPYQDEKGNTHDAESGAFIKKDEFRYGKSDEHYKSTLAEGDISGESLEQLAQRVADARKDGDKTRASDAEEAFFAKFNTYAEKYGWEDEVVDQSAAGQLAVDKNATIGRDTIDARLERYGAIMYGDEQAATDTTETGSSEQTVATAETTDEPAAEQSLLPNMTPEELERKLAAVKRAKQEHEQSESEPEAAEATEAETDDPMADVPNTPWQPPVIDADRLARMQASLSETESTESPAEPLSLEGLDAVDASNTEPALEGESLDEYEARHGVQDTETISLEGLELLSPDADEQAQSQSRWKRIGARLNPIVLYHRAQAWNYQRGERERSSERSNNKKAMIGLGVLGVAVAGTAIYLGNKYGVDFQPGNNSSNGGGNELAKPTGGNGLNWKDFDPSARNVTPGEGFYSTFDQMGIAKKDWADVLNTAGPKLGKLGEAYYDNSSNEWRISRSGKLSNDALRVIASASRKNGVEL